MEKCNEACSRDVNFIVTANLAFGIILYSQLARQGLKRLRALFLRRLLVSMTPEQRGFILLRIWFGHDCELRIQRAIFLEQIVPS